MWSLEKRHRTAGIMIMDIIESGILIMFRSALLPTVFRILKDRDIERCCLAFKVQIYFTPKTSTNQIPGG